MNIPNPSPDKLTPEESKFTTSVRELGGIATLELFNDAELVGGGSVATPTDSEMVGIALRDDGLVHVRSGRHDSFTLPYARARQLAVSVAREELNQQTANHVAQA